MQLECTYCFVSWSCKGTTILKPIELLYKKTLKVFDKKPYSFYHCDILAKHSFLSFDNFKHFRIPCLMFKVLHGLAPPPLNGFIKLRADSGLYRDIRASARGDCEVPFRCTTFEQAMLSVIGSKYWNSLPFAIRECPMYRAFKTNLKGWLKANQICSHN